MAQVIEFVKNVQTGMYESEITPTGSRIAVQVKFDEQDASFQPASAYMNVLAQIDSESEKVFVASVEMWHNQNRMFVLDFPSGTIVTLQTAMPVLEAKILDILDV